MAYERKVVQQATARLERRKEMRQRKRYDLEQQLYRRQPRLRTLDIAIRGTMLELAELLTAGVPLAADGPEIGDIRRRNLALQEERAQLLKNLGYAPDALDDTPACSLCGDTGWVGQEMCQCLRQLCAQEQLRQLTALLHLTPEQSFAQLRLDVYSDQPWDGHGRSPRENMKRVILVCQGFAQQFPNYPLKNLLLSGGTGLGKTFLSGCIAREVSDRGYSVVYDSAIHMQEVFSNRQFSRDQEKVQEAEGLIRCYLDCDLLLLDDLGSESTTAPFKAALYEVLDGRIQRDKRTIISTNLAMPRLAELYSPQVASRLEGLFQELTFYGDDIRRSAKQLSSNPS
ncbi:MAG TPA: DNA replication protein DnaC [Clostridiales bacterium]|nr:DNA replication protein DnaC [Clostridiales bacterium]